MTGANAIWTPSQILIDYAGGFQFDEDPSDAALESAWQDASALTKLWFLRLYGNPPSNTGFAEWIKAIREERLDALNS